MWFLPLILALSSPTELSQEENDLVAEILTLAEKSDRTSYYLFKLNQLLNTPENKNRRNFKEKNLQIINNSIDSLTNEYQEIEQGAGQTALSLYLNIEEDYQFSQDRTWTVFLNHDRVFYIARDDPNDILVYIKVNLRDSEFKEKIIFMEDGIEKHLSTDGFSVNLEFVDQSALDVFEVDVNLDQWPTSKNWSGGYMMLSHELAHLLGLKDEYDLIESHSTNQYFSIKMRLRFFLHQMNDFIPPDAKNGLMNNYRKKLLDRHICEIAGFTYDCRH